MDDPYNLQRFVDAQAAGGSYARALEEIRRGRKVSHWFWYVFPQLRGLGSSAMSREYAISSLAEAQSYLHHSVLGPRLIDITTAATSHADKTAADIFGPDDVKFRSSMTLFGRAAPSEGLFHVALDQFFGATTDERTDLLLDAASEEGQ